MSAAAPLTASDAIGRPEVTPTPPKAPGAPVPSPDGASAPPAVPAVCTHGLPLRGVEECRRCLPGGRTVATFIAEHPDGADLITIGAALGISREGVRKTEAKALTKLLRVVRVMFPELVEPGTDPRNPGPRLSAAERLAVIVHRMLRDGFGEDEIASALNEPDWRIANAVRSRRKAG